MVWYGGCLVGYGWCMMMGVWLGTVGVRLGNGYGGLRRAILVLLFLLETS